ncbi:hypothetical protein LB465_14065 [Salegentibacter sp. LM13S]|uniref:hypothetical protein n=1 Tax=Salegentibacter lacus TaxID=2873599 RepID=UPI001CCD0747|nr:hypothetical protein [Salegentibacter lacus]MBZ9631910.1 hypothetical protein [Salegentibacter lacus]
MKTITLYLMRFALTVTILTILFRYFLSYGIENLSGIIITLSAGIYGILTFVAGWYFGRKDGEYLPIFDVGFRFHLTTFLIHNGISLLWIGFGFGSKSENLNAPIMGAIIWSVFLLIHFIFYLWARRNSIHNLNKEDIFE